MMARESRETRHIRLLSEGLRGPLSQCPRCRNTGKHGVPGRHTCPYDNGSWCYCDCEVGRAVARVESSMTNAEDMPEAVRSAIRVGADITGVQIPRYIGRPVVNRQLDEIEAVWKKRNDA